jgi:DNA processing protein
VVPTVAVVATGLDSCYPAEHRTLFSPDRGGGAILSFRPVPPIKVHFIRRNRLLAGLRG